jgi:hypothetical protein
MAQGEKELWRLRWEYLKRSDNFARYCEMANDPDFVPDDDLLWSYLRSNYRIFANLYTENFDDWWKSNRRYAVKKEYLTPLRTNDKDVVDYALLIADDMNEFRKRFVTPPSTDEFIKAFSNHLKAVRWLYLRINILGVSELDIVSQMREIMKKKKQSPAMRLHKNALSLYDNPQGIRGELKKYLEVYDLKKSGKSTRQIIECIGTKAEKANSDDNDIQRPYKRYFQKAKKIIRNVERLDFPGKY